MRGWRWLLAAGVAAAVVAAGAGCGGDDGGGGDGDGGDTPRLAGTPLATATSEPIAEAVCEIAQPVTAPANLPADVAFPPDYVIASVETAPHLRITGRVKPPPDPEAAAEGLALLPTQIFENAFIMNMRDGWTFRLNLDVDGRDYNFTAPDGREGHFNANLVEGCAGYADVTFDLFWITPSAN